MKKDTKQPKEQTSAALKVYPSTHALVVKEHECSQIPMCLIVDRAIKLYRKLNK
jgi:hypothetical protein